jgi:acyl dehydratase
MDTEADVAPNGKKWFDFETLEIPYDLGTMDITPTPDMWDRYRRIMGDDTVFITNALKPRSVLTYRTLPTRPSEQHINSGHDAEYFNKPIPGKRLTMRATIVDKYIKRDKPYVVTLTEVVDEDGRLIERYRRTTMVKSAKLGEKWWAKPTSATEVGATLTPVKKTFTLEMMRDFEKVYWQASGYDDDHHGFHDDESMAQKAGLRQPIVSAHMTISFFHDLLNKFFGHDWIEGGRLNIKFIRPVTAGETVTYKGLVTDKVREGEKTRLILELWTENQEGNKTAVATASALVD